MDKLDPRSFKSIFVGYPTETMGYSFYSPSKNKVFVAWNAEFFESKLLDLKASGSSRKRLTWMKKTDMDGVVHTYKARLVVKGYTQLYRVDYEETFLPVADIRAIRILISIAAFYDYEI
nr:putative retrotransposon Ty1-copia subclass protein [Tanacetum cinerariifolium]